MENSPRGKVYFLIKVCKYIIGLMSNKNIVDYKIMKVWEK
jgi:hypothetical protein